MAAMDSHPKGSIDTISSGSPLKALKSSVSVDNSEIMNLLEAAGSSPDLAARGSYSAGARHFSSISRSGINNDACHNASKALSQYELPVEVKKLEVGAGAKIRQELCRFDPSSPDFYQDEPVGMIYLNYCTEEDLNRILSAGSRDQPSAKEGFLSGLQVGN
jgi:hypothetical protein